MRLSAGTHLGPYEITAPLGAGGMGEVYRARDARLGRDVALKILHAEVADDASRRQRFVLEARAVAALNHPNIVGIYDVGAENGVCYIVSELIDGETLRAAKFPLRKTLDIAAQIAAGLAAAHEAGIVHRDLKPDNILLTRDGLVKILDFGLAKLAARGAAAAAANGAAAVQTEPGMVMGTVGYMSPEQVRGADTDHRSDIFSFGVILHELLTGQRAFQGDTHAETMTAILKQDAPELPAEFPPSLKQIEAHCLEKEPSHRFQSSRDLAFALRALSGSTQQVAALIEPEPPKRRRWWPVPAAALLLIAAVAGGTWLGKSLFARPLPAFTRLTFQRGFVSGARFIGDGKNLIYSAAWEGSRSEIYSARFESPDARPLGLPGAHLFAVSSSGEMAVALDSTLGSIPILIPRGSLARVPVSGGAPRVLLSDVEDADWEPHGDRLAVAHVVGAVSRLEFPIGKVLYETSGYINSVHFSPDGSRIAFADHLLRNDDRGSVAVVDLSGKKTVLSPGWATLEGLAWAPGGKEIWFAAANGGLADSVWAVTLSGQRRLLFHSPSPCYLRDIAADGRVLLDTSTSRMEMSGFQDTGSGGASQRNLAWLDFSEPADLTPDGKTVLFTESGISSNYIACLRNTDGSPVVRLGDGAASALSPDGKWALADVFSSPQQLILIPTGAGEAVHLPQKGLEYQRFGLFFSDSQRILFSAREPGHGLRLWVQGVFPPDQPRAITAEGVTLRGKPLSPDGKTVAALGPNFQTAFYPVDGGDPRPIPGVGPYEQCVRWSVDGTQLFTVTLNRIPAIVYKVDIATGHKEAVREIAPSDPAGVTSVNAVVLTGDAKSGVYSFPRNLSVLQIVQGLQ